MPPFFRKGEYVEVDREDGRYPWYGVVIIKSGINYTIRLGGSGMEIQVDQKHVKKHPSISKWQNEWNTKAPDKLVIPRLIHFVWIGAMPPNERWSNIDQWKKLNPSCKIVLWSDSKWIPCESEPKNEYAKIVQKANTLEIGYCDIRTLNPPDYYLKESGQKKRSSFDKDKLWTNFGTASDLARYYILYKYGGIYADSDLPLKTSGATAIDITALNSGINEKRNVVEGNPLQLYLHNRGNLSRLTNDLIITPPQNPVVHHLIKQVHSALDRIYENNDNINYYMETKKGLTSGRSVCTQQTTGPENVRIILQNYYRWRSGKPIPNSRIAFSYNSLKKLGGSGGSACSWLKDYSK